MGTVAFLGCHPYGVMVILLSLAHAERWVDSLSRRHHTISCYKNMSMFPASGNEPVGIKPGNDDVLVCPETT